MSNPRLQPPGGEPAPVAVALGSGPPLDLVLLAREVCRRYRLEFPDEQERYGDAGNLWCVHDNQYLLHWGAEAADGFLDLRHEVAWLARVLESRQFPLERLARNLDIAAEVVTAQVEADRAEQLAEVLTDGAAFVRSRPSFLG